MSTRIRFSLALILSLLAALPSFAAPPQTLNYQGYLTSPTGTPINTSVVMTFKLYNAPTGGAPLYTESQFMVPVTNGSFNAVIGAVTPIPLPFDVPYWLTVAVNADAEMSPRQPLTSSAYAFRAATATTANTTAAIQGSAVSAAVPTDGQVLIFRGGQWQPAADVANLLASGASNLNSPRAYVANRFSNNVTVIDTASNTVVGAPIAVGTNPQAIAVNPSGSRAYVVNAGSSSVTVIDTTTNAVLTMGGTIAVGFGPVAIAVNPSGSRAYVTNQGSDIVTVIDTATNTVVGAAIAVGSSPRGIAVNPSGSRAYVANYNSNNVTVIDTATNTVVGVPITVGMSPRAIAVNPSGSRAFVANYSSNNVTVIDTASNTVVGAPIAVGTNPVAIAVK